MQFLSFSRLGPGIRGFSTTAYRTGDRGDRVAPLQKTGRHRAGDTLRGRVSGQSACIVNLYTPAKLVRARCPRNSRRCERFMNQEAGEAFDIDRGRRRSMFGQEYNSRHRLPGGSV